MQKAPDLSGLRVLLLEDEMLVSMLIEDMLDEQRCVIVGPFSTVSDAMVAARAEAFDFAVLDVNVGGVKAYPVAETLEARGIPFLFLSGYGQSAMPSDRPDWRVCSKPFRNDQLIEFISRQLARR